MYLVWPLACIVVVVVASNKKNLRRGEANSRGRAHLRRESGPAMTRALSGEHTFQRGSGHWPKRKTTGLLRRCFLSMRRRAGNGKHAGCGRAICSAERAAQAHCTRP